jgi:hypothetical protein
VVRHRKYRLDRRGSIGSLHRLLPLTGQGFAQLTPATHEGSEIAGTILCLARGRGRGLGRRARRCRRTYEALAGTKYPLIAIAQA